ncbi:MAG TPA: PAS domain-containing protein [Stellaceae bacterium]|nr:PAS domain-containing protein [Stellaceae bacterium]
MEGEGGFDISTAEERVRRLYAYWNERRGDKPFPARGDIDPIDFDFALGFVSLVDVLDRPRRFFYRLVSTGLTQHLGFEMTGKEVDDLPGPEMRAYVRYLYTRALWNRAPLYDKGEITLDGTGWEHETLVLPLSDDGAAINKLMIYRRAFPNANGSASPVD